MKKFYQENRVFVILMGIVIICLIIIISLLLIYFYKGNGSNKYGDRLDDIKSLEIKKSRLDELETKIKKLEKVKDCYAINFGKIIYISITFEEEMDLVTAQGKAALLLEEFSDEEKSVYDFQFTIKEDKKDGFILSGAKNHNTATLIWSNLNLADGEENEK